MPYIHTLLSTTLHICINYLAFHLMKDCFEAVFIEGRDMASPKQTTKEVPETFVNN